MLFRNQLLEEPKHPAHQAPDPRLVVLGGALSMALLLVLGRAAAIGLAILAFACALRLGGGRRLVVLCAGIGTLTVVLHALTEPGAALIRLGPIAVTLTGIVSGGERAARLIGLASAGWWVAHALGIERLADLAVRVTWPFERRWPRLGGLGFAAGLALRFLPEVGCEVARLRLALAARPAGAHSLPAGRRETRRPLGPWRARVEALEPLFLPLLAGTVRRAGEVARTLDARGYGSGPRTSAATGALTPRERWLGGAMVAGAALAIAVDRLAGRG